MLRLINEGVGVSGKTAAHLVEEGSKRGRLLRLYLEPSILVKLFKAETGSDDITSASVKWW